MQSRLDFYPGHPLWIKVTVANPVPGYPPAGNQETWTEITRRRNGSPPKTAKAVVPLDTDVLLTVTPSEPTP
eukprot:1031047-Rhodomonas_salina.2